MAAASPAVASCGKNSSIGPSETEVGITEFMWPVVAGFPCRFKERWHDFQVYEIDQNGTELHLDELITPGAVSAELKAASVARREARSVLGPDFTPDPAVDEDIRAALGAVAADSLFTFLRQQRPSAAPDETTKNGGEAPPPFTDVDADTIGDGSGSKDARKRAHRAILEHFGSFLNTETVESDSGARTLRIWMRDAEQKAKIPAANSDARATGTDAGGRGKGKKGGKGKGKGKKANKAGKGGKSGPDQKTCGDDDSSAAAVGSAGEFGTFRREGWPKDRPDYLYFRLYKENCDTSEGVASIAKCVGRSVKLFTFAGTKDRRASTVQQVCAYRLPADQLRRTLTHRLWDKRLRICRLEYRPDRLRLGDLQGNCFRVALRGVPAASVVAGSSTASPVEQAFAAVRDGGFLNYFGLQRFGTRTVRTHHVGAAFIGGRWELAVRLILGDEDAISSVRGDAVPSRKRPTENGLGSAEEPPLKAARIEDCSMPLQSAHADSEPSSKDDVKPDELIAEDQGLDVTTCTAANDELQKERVPKWKLIRDAQRCFLETGDAQKALECMPKSQHLERCVLGALARQLPHAEALRQLPHQALSLYAHSAQSLVWNAVLSHRIRNFGIRPVEGDIVLAGGSSSSRDSRKDAGGVQSMEDADMFIEAEDGFEDTSDIETGALPSVRVLTKSEDVASAEMADVLLPLPGSDVEYPAYLRDAYENAAQKFLGLSLADFHDSRLVPLRGAYRHAVVKPGGLECQLLEQEGVQEAGSGSLMASDVARLLEAREAAKGCGKDAGEVSANADTAVSNSADDKMDAGTADSETSGVAAKFASTAAGVVFKCTLPPSAYLTMLLREVSKQSTE